MRVSQDTDTGRYYVLVGTARIPVRFMRSLHSRVTNKIEAIKLLRDAYDLGLAEAKDAYVFVSMAFDLADGKSI